MASPVILAIESSCDDTAAAVVQGGKLRANVRSSQLEHTEFGGVVPEIASRAHQRYIAPVVQQALDEAGTSPDALDAVAVTYGPGLAGSLLVGLSFAKSFALGLGLPVIGVNHLEGHIYSVMIEEPRPSVPFLSLVVSGGHSQLVLVEQDFRHTVLGRTRDDAAGEAFDKVAKLLDLGYPGGPPIDELARNGNASFHEFPRSRPGDFDFSFSGLKTSVLYYLHSFPDDKARTAFLDDHLADVCASFQQAIVDVLVDVLREAVHETNVRQVAVTGGVSANSQLRKEVAALGREEDVGVFTPAPQFCMDNAAMIAATAAQKLEAGRTSPLTLTAEPSLALDSL